MRAEVHLAQILIHRDSRGGQVATRIGHLRHLKKTLDATILAVLAVKGRQEQIYLNNAREAPCA